LTDPQGDHGVDAIGKLLAVLKPLDSDTRINVLQFVFKALNINLSGITAASLTAAPAQAIHTPAPHDHTPPPPAPTVSTPTDIRTLREIKNPTSANQMVAVMAYYLENVAPQGERRDFITADDIKPYFNQANFPLPTGRTSMTLVNTKNAGYLDALNGGKYRLNPVGHNLVVHKLGREDGGSLPRPARRSAVRKTAKKGTAKKKARK
jgi:hypothetical protein